MYLLTLVSSKLYIPTHRNPSLYPTLVVRVGGMRVCRGIFGVGWGLFGASGHKFYLLSCSSKVFCMQPNFSNKHRAIFQRYNQGNKGLGNIRYIGF